MPFWAKAGLGVLALTLLALGVREHLQAREEARDADARADSALAVADSATEALDAALSRLDSVQAREGALRDSLRDALAQAGEEASQAGEAVEVQTASLDTTLAELTRRVRPELQPLARQARAQADSLEQAHATFRLAMESQIQLLERDRASLERELAQTRSALDDALATLADERAAKRRLEEARDKWREAAHPFGISVGGETLGLVGLGVGLAAGLAVK